jgi:hypothetical protein
VKQALVVALALAAAGCGGGSSTASKVTPTTGAAAKAPATGAPASGSRAAGGGSAGGALPAVEVAVIRNWSSELAGGHVAAASAYFATPSVLQVDPNYPAVTLRTQAAVRAANQAFPCGAKLLSTRLVDGYVDALFLLGDRPGGGPGGCGTGTGLTARVAFRIRAGLIVSWLRIPDEPGDSSHDGPGAGAPPAAPSGPGSGSGVSAI